MKHVEPCRHAFTASLQEMTDQEFYATLYNLAIGEAFVRLGLLEDTIIHAMTMCDKIVVKTKLGSDAKTWELMLEKRSALQDSTLGSLISILERHRIDAKDVRYLRWVKVRRDFFVHRFFHDGRWPGDISEGDSKQLIRQLQYLKIVFWRAQSQMWRILSNNGLLIRHNLGEAGALLFNVGSIIDDKSPG